MAVVNKTWRDGLEAPEEEERLLLSAELGRCEAAGSGGHHACAYSAPTY